MTKSVVTKSVFSSVSAAGFRAGESRGRRARAPVLLPFPFDTPFDYALPDGMTLVPGDYVRVPLGRKLVIGVVWDADETSGEAAPGRGRVPDSKLKPVAERFDLPPMALVTRQFIDWVAAYTLAAKGSVLKMALSVPGAMDPPAPVPVYRASAALPPDLRLTAQRTRVLAVASAAGLPLTASELARDASVGVGVVRALAASGGLDRLDLVPGAATDLPDPDHPGPRLTDDQRRAADMLVSTIRESRSGPILLDGVTGAGKTEVYFEAIAETLRHGRQVLVLLPEIALTVQWLDRFRDRFDAAPTPWHSELPPAVRRMTWRAIAESRAWVVVGARSALFLPFADLGLIVVDEEHDPSFKQEEGVMYHARDMAVVRGHLGDVPVVLSSATPSLETVTNVEIGRYRRVALPDRHGGAVLPAIEAVDMRAMPPPRGSWLAEPVVAGVREALAAGEQAMLFLNRRGYAPLTLCRDCGHRFECPHCTAWLVEHRGRGRLQCHHCGFEVAAPDTCPACGAEESLVACGPGVERIAEEAARLFPHAHIAVMASDTIAGPHAAEALVRKVRERQVDLLVGTQIVAKGHHFPLLTFVGVVDADLGLGGGDLRAVERTYQLLYQVAGRAGRAARPGRVVLQTYDPGHPVMAALIRGDRDGFIAAEAASRRLGAMPPFGRLVALIVSGPKVEAVDRVARALGRAAPRPGPWAGQDLPPGVLVLGPAPAPFALLRGRHRRRLLLKAPRTLKVQGLVRQWVDAVEVPTGVRVQIDVDPYSFL